jgi:hypothetical protein
VQSSQDLTISTLHFRTTELGSISREHIDKAKKPMQLLEVQTICELSCRGTLEVSAEPGETNRAGQSLAAEQSKATGTETRP